MICTVVPADGCGRGEAGADPYWRAYGHVDARPAWRVPAVEAGIDLAECHSRRPDRRRLLCYRVRSGVLRVAPQPRCYVPQRVLGIRDLRHGLRGDPPVVDPHFVG